MRSARRAVVGTALVSGVVTAAVASLPELHFAYREPALHTALETVAGSVMLLATFLVFGRLQREMRLNELLLAYGLALLGPATVAFELLATAMTDEPRSVASWEGRISSVTGAILLAAAAVAPARPLRRPRRAAAITVGAVAVLFGVTALVVSVTNARLTRTSPSASASRSAVWPDLHGGHVLLALHLVAALAFAVAAVNFLRRAERSGDEFLAWISATAVLASFSRINYALFPTRYTDWVYTGDGFRLMSYLVLMVGAMREISSYWRSAAEAAVLEERRRIARDLHDGVAQEIAYLGRNVRSLRPRDEEQAQAFDRLRRATERAQLEARQALGALAARRDEPLDVALARAVTDVADRFGAVVELELTPGVRVSPRRAECLLRIACEAVANAARHSGAGRVALSLDRTGARVRLRVRDEGCGFDVAHTNGGFGLVSMQERAQSVGGRVAVESGPGRGTLVEVAL